MQAFPQCKPHFNHQLAVLWHGRSRGQWGARTRSLSLGAVGCSAAPLGLCWGKQDLAHKSWVALWLGCSLPLALQALRSVRWASPTSWPDPTDYPNACSSCPCPGRVLRDLSPAPKPWPIAAMCEFRVTSGTPVMWVQLVQVKCDCPGAKTQIRSGVWSSTRMQFGC